MSPLPSFPAPPARPTGLVADYADRHRLSDATVRHFDLGSDPLNRLLVPVLDGRGELAGFISKAVHESGTCKACKEVVAAKEMAARAGTDEHGVCPRCGASKQKARLAWLVTQHPRYNAQRDLKMSDLLYHSSQTREAARGDRKSPLVVCDSLPDCWAAYEAGYKLVVCWAARRPSQRQVELIESLALIEEVDCERVHRQVLILREPPPTPNEPGETLRGTFQAAGLAKVYSVNYYGEGAEDAAAGLRMYGAKRLADFIELGHAREVALAGPEA